MALATKLKELYTETQYKQSKRAKSGGDEHNRAAPPENVKGDEELRAKRRGRKRSVKGIVREDEQKKQGAGRNKKPGEIPIEE